MNSKCFAIFFQQRSSYVCSDSYFLTECRQKNVSRFSSRHISVTLSRLSPHSLMSGRLFKVSKKCRKFIKNLDVVETVERFAL